LVLPRAGGMLSMIIAAVTIAASLPVFSFRVVFNTAEATGGGAACTFCRAIHGICINLMRTFCETAWRNNKLYYGRLYCRPTAVLDGVKWLFQLVIMHANAQISTLKFSSLSPIDGKPIYGCDNRCVLVCERLTHKHAPVVTPMYSL